VTGRAAIVGAWLVALSACTVSPEGNPALRCDGEGTCPEAQFCHAGFCIAHDDESTEQDEAPAHASDLDAGLADGSRDAEGGAASDEGAEEPVGGNNGSTGSGSQRDAGGEDETSGEDVTSDDEGEEPGTNCLAGLCCGLGLVPCGDRCVNLLESVLNCGECGVTCGPGRSCNGGLCCKHNEIACDGECVNPARDKDHCGSCNHACSEGCKDGLCKEDS
jgi:hypothetical protein